MVSLVPSLSELVEALHPGALVGVTRYCVRPAGLRERAGVTTVGGTKSPDVAAIRALQPDLVLANREENERRHVEALAETLDVVVTDVRTVADAEAMVADVGERLGRGPEGRALAAEIRAARAAVSARPPARPVRFVAAIWRKPWMAAGPDTFLSDLLTTAGGVNALADADERYPEIDLGELRARSPDVILLTSEPFPFTAVHVREVRRAVGAPAVLADGELLEWYGPRTAAGIRYAADLLESAAGGSGSAAG